jgi:hypothetical protein
MVETFAEPMYAKYLKIGLIAMYLQDIGLSESKVVSLAC